MRRPVEELVGSAVAGGGFRISWRHYKVEELVSIAAAGAARKGTITVTDADREPIEDLIRVAVAGQGTIVYASTD